MTCNHTRDESWWEYDARNIPLCRVCEKCVRAQLAKYRKDVLYNSQYEASEPIDEEEYY